MKASGHLKMLINRSFFSDIIGFTQCDALGGQSLATKNGFSESILLFQKLFLTALQRHIKGTVMR